MYLYVYGVRCWTRWSLPPLSLFNAIMSIKFHVYNATLQAMYNGPHSERTICSSKQQRKETMHSKKFALRERESVWQPTWSIIATEYVRRLWVSLIEHQY